MRVGVIALLHESNTFVAQHTLLRHFSEDVLLEGEAIRDRFQGTHHELGGFFAELDEHGTEVVPIFAARALPFGTIAADDFDALVERMLAAVARAGRVDGLLAAAHGATVAENHRDADGYWFGRLRRLVGPELAIVATIDPHANVSADMQAAVDALIAYRTNPHVDQFQCGREAAALLVRTLRGEVRPIMAVSDPPLAINIERQLTSASPCREAYDLADEMLTRPRVLSNSIVLGFPYADVPEMGCSAIVVTDNDGDLAVECAARLGQHLWERREEFVGHLIDVDEALEQASRAEAPVCLLDMGDNVGGGSPADGTVLAQALNDRRCARAFVCLYDPAAAEQARQAGIGQQLVMRVGGHSDRLHGEPLEAAFTVESLHDGRFTDHQPRHGGFAVFDQGPTAVVRTAGDLWIMLTTRRMAPFSLEQLISCGLKPETFRYLVAKGVHAPVAAYQNVCRTFIRINTPGVTTADMSRLTYRHRRAGLFPLDSDAEWTPFAITFSRE